MDVGPGEVTALVGDNGAGKSVLLKCIAGIHEADAGQILWKGEPVRIRTPRDAAALGVATVYQDLALCDNLDVVGNLYLGRERTRHGVLDEIAMEATTRATLEDLGVTSVRSPRQRVGCLSGGQRQAVAIAKAVFRRAELIIMDEPTAALGVAQTQVVLSLIRRLAAHGMAVVIVSHNMNDVFAVADRIIILYLGRVAGSFRTSEVDPHDVVRLMTLGPSELTHTV
jgi:ABC-type sugar transport system ATPase subunit